MRIIAKNVKLLTLITDHLRVLFSSVLLEVTDVAF
jgi:hypothetical protein